MLPFINPVTLQDFWISWLDDTLRIGRSANWGKDEVFRYYKKQQFTTNAVSFRSSVDNTGEWTYIGSGGKSDVNPMQPY